jgi:hypothetical protein
VPLPHRTATSRERPPPPQVPWPHRHRSPSGMHAASGQPDRAGRTTTCSQRPGAGQRLAASGQGMRQRHAVRKKRPGVKTPNHVTNTCISPRKLIKGSPNLIIAMSQRLDSYYSKVDVRNPIITKRNVWSPIIANFSLNPC